MSHQPDLLRHDTHDLELVAAYVAGDTTGPDQDTAAALATGCAACATAAAELRAIARALPALPPPRRTRDYRLDPATAARLRPTGWRSLLAPLATRRFAFAAPLGTALATLGLAGLLVVGLPGALPGAGGAADRGTTGQPQELQAGGEPPAVPASQAPEPTALDALGGPAGASPAAKVGPDAVTGRMPEPAPDASTASDSTGGSGILAGPSLLVFVLGAVLLAIRIVARRAFGGP